MDNLKYPKYKMVNCTGHDIHDAMSFMTYPAERMVVARMNYNQTPAAQTEDGSIIYQTDYLSLSGLPDPVEGTKYIVSSKTLNAALALGRVDCVAVNDVIRDRNGIVQGCKGFRMNG